MNNVKKFLGFVLCAALIASCIFNISVSAVTYPAKAKINSTSGVAKIYSLAGTTGHEAAEADKNKSELLCELSNGTEVRILGEETDGDGDLWYKIGYGDNYQSIGYAFSSRVSIIYDYIYDEDFEKNLQNFPESYRDALRQLHAKYPNWQFLAHDVNISFEEAVQSQYGVDDIKDTRKWVEFTYGGNEWRDLRGYDQQSDSWVTLETRWTYASRTAIEYFMDPRNSLDENKIFVFALQSYNEDMHSADSLRAVIKNTFLEKGYDKNNDGIAEPDAYIEDIMSAAELSGVSPDVLASTIIIEQGANGESAMISGNYKGFEGYYNFFNFSASGNTVDQIVTSALTYAKNNGWNSRSVAIIEGAKKYADGYISVGQDTYYYKDFNVVNKIWWHQYAAALYDAWTNANYLKKGCLTNAESALVFKIPVYSNLPDSACPLPSAQQSPEETISLGDINGDYTINNKDLGLLMQYLNGWDVQVNVDMSDVNRDNAINNKDYGILMQYVNGWDVSLGGTTDENNHIDVGIDLPTDEW